MVHKCSVKICKNYKHKGTKVKFFKFPYELKEITTLEKWVSFCNQKPGWKPDSDKEICEVQCVL
jgi:hypothetical protein